MNVTDADHATSSTMLRNEISPTNHEVVFLAGSATATTPSLSSQVIAHHSSYHHQCLRRHASQSFGD